MRLRHLRGGEHKDVRQGSDRLRDNHHRPSSATSGAPLHDLLQLRPELEAPGDCLHLGQPDPDLGPPDRLPGPDARPPADKLRPSFRVRLQVATVLRDHYLCFRGHRDDHPGEEVHEGPGRF